MKKENKKPTVHYLSLRNIPEFEKENRRNPPSGQKQDYVIETIISLGYKVNYVSFSESFNKKWYRAKKKKLSDKVTFFLTPSMCGKYRESIAFRWFYHIYSLKHIKKGDILLVYHTNSMRNDILRRLADKKKLKFIYEVEEVYAYVQKEVNEKQVKEEIEFLQCADKYMFCSELLQQTVNLKNLPYAIAEGYYKYLRKDVCKFNDGKIHLVYSGIIDSVRGGAFRVVEMANYLPDNYVVHISGYGNTDKLKNLIEDNSDKRRCEIIYEGLLKIDDYIELLSKCDIGLNLMTMREDVNKVTFPSKLVVYTACGLKVVSCRVKVLEMSRLSENITFYDKDEPKAMADAVLSVDLEKDNDTKELMEKLDKEFSDNLEKLFSEK